MGWVLFCIPEHRIQRKIFRMCFTEAFWSYFYTSIIEHSEIQYIRVLIQKSFYTFQNSLLWKLIRFLENHFWNGLFEKYKITFGLACCRKIKIISRISQFKSYFTRSEIVYTENLLDFWKITFWIVCFETYKNDFRIGLFQKQN